MTEPDRSELGTDTLERLTIERRLKVLQSVKDGDGIFVDPRDQSAAWKCVEDGLILSRIAVFRNESETTAATIASGRGAWRHVGLSEHAERFLENGGPPVLSTFVEEDSPRRQAARAAAIERAREIASS